MIDRSFGSIYFLPCSNSLLGIATSHIGLIRSLYCSVFKEPSLFKRLDYLTTFVEVCQMIFLKSFSSLFRTGPLHQRRVLSYHTAFLVSTVFSCFFDRASYWHCLSSASEKDFSLRSKQRCRAWLSRPARIVHKKRRCEITIISFSRSICRGGLAALIGVTGKPYPSCLSCHSHPIRPFRAPSPRGEGCDTRIPSSKKRRRSRHENPEP